jgi:hypothetical protein
MREKREGIRMKGGVQSMLHIVVWNGIVTEVIQLSDHPDKQDTRLEEEFDYKVEYYPIHEKGE